MKPHRSLLWTVVLTVGALATFQTLEASPKVSRAPVAVSPGRADAPAVVEDRCPTFSWGGVEDARAYELLVVPAGAEDAAEHGAIPVALRARVPGSARSYTPALGSCLERGAAYAWLVRAIRADGGRGEWSEAVAIEVAKAPSVVEVEQALEVLHAYLDDFADDRADNRAPTTRIEGSPADAVAATKPEPDHTERGDDRHPPARPIRDHERRLVEALSAETRDLPERTVAAGTAPDPAGPVSLSIADHLELAADSAVIRDGDPFLWSDGSNLALGNAALAASTSNSLGNTAVGIGALAANLSGDFNVAVGQYALAVSQGYDNTAVGFRALESNTQGGNNVAVGRRALRQNVDGNGNVAVGEFAMTLNTSGYYNTAVGTSALESTEGIFNSAFGSFALGSSETGDGNTAVGFSALEYTNANHNTAVGYFALTQNTTGTGLVAVGANALSAESNASDNTAVGFDALRANTDGTSNTAVGKDALTANTTGGGNTAVGEGALAANSTGAGNTAVGEDALTANTGGLNTAVGEGALDANLGATRNTAVGQAALGANTTGNDNTAVGKSALLANVAGARNTAVGENALDGTTGSDNIALGQDAGQALTTGNFNIMIGNDGVAAEGNTIRIGIDGTHTSTFIAGIEDSEVNGSVVEVLATGELGVAPSSRRFKHDIHTLDAVTGDLLRLRPVRFRYRPELVAGGGKVELGLVAEEVDEVLPELVTHDANGRPYTVRYHLLTPLLLAELQRQEAVIQDLSERLERVERRGNRSRRAGG